MVGWLAHPATLLLPAVSDCEQPVREPGPPLVGVPDLIVKVTVELSAVTVLPNWSCTVSCGCGESALSALPLEGDCVNASWVAAPGVMLKLVLVAPVRLPLAA